MDLKRWFWRGLRGNRQLLVHDDYVASVNGGSPVDPKSIEGGKAAVKPANSAREGYAFGGWGTVIFAI